MPYRAKISEAAAVIFAEAAACAVAVVAAPAAVSNVAVVAVPATLLSVSTETLTLPLSIASTFPAGQVWHVDPAAAPAAVHVPAGQFVHTVDPGCEYC